MLVGKSGAGYTNKTTQPARAALQSPHITTYYQTRIIATLSSQRLLVETPSDAHLLHYRHLVIASGASELLLPVAGWTLPGVTGIGGLQALVKAGLPITGKRVVIAGTGGYSLAYRHFFARPRCPHRRHRRTTITAPVSPLRDPPSPLSPQTLAGRGLRYPACRHTVLAW
jgi:pyruvate/2-oxoglutarate dehydrogenase complex dihydrolipoamide dehydrogenase (E3) component